MRALAAALTGVALAGCMPVNLPPKEVVPMPDVSGHLPAELHASKALAVVALYRARVTVCTQGSAMHRSCVPELRDVLARPIFIRGTDIRTLPDQVPASYLARGHVLVSFLGLSGGGAGDRYDLRMLCVMSSEGRDVRMTLSIDSWSESAEIRLSAERRASLLAALKSGGKPVFSGSAPCDMRGDDDWTQDDRARFAHFLMPEEHRP